MWICSTTCRCWPQSVMVHQGFVTKDQCVHMQSAEKHTIKLNVDTQHTCKLLACSPSSSMAFRTARPPAEHTGFPPKVLKCSRRDMVFAISSVVTTAAKGKPLPMPFAIVTISGTTPWFSNPQNLVPVLPNPVCTSSAMQTPPAALTCYKISNITFAKRSLPNRQSVIIACT